MKELELNLLKLFRTFKILNGYEACRLVNGFGRREVSICYKGLGYASNREKNPNRKRGCHELKNRCKYPNRQVYGALKNLMEKGLLSKKKMRFYDSWGNQADIFTYCYFRDEDFEELILRQTLVPYLGDKHNVLEASQK